MAGPFWECDHCDRRISRPAEKPEETRVCVNTWHEGEDCVLFATTEGLCRGCQTELIADITQAAHAFQRRPFEEKVAARIKAEEAD